MAAKGPVQLLDCDVEEPNAHIFFSPSIEQKNRCTLIVPSVIESNCTYCGKCRDICRFNAITVFNKIIMTFPELCHSCRGCFLICPEDALAETEREIGFVEKGHANGISFVQGKLRIGEAMSPPLIKAVKAEAETSSECLVILDSPPGTSCPVIATVNDADYTLLVTEPTPFGLYDLKLAVGMLRKLKRSFGVILNRSDLGNGDVGTWCRQENIPIHLNIPFDRRIAEGYARGEPLIVSRPDLRSSFESLLEELVQ